MKQLTVATLKLLGNHSALDFTNTVDSRSERFGPDVLQSYGDLLDWGMRLSVLDAAEVEALRGLPAERGIAALTRAKVLREALYRIFATRPWSGPLDLDLLRSEVGAAHTMLLPDADGYAWHPGGQTIPTRSPIASPSWPPTCSLRPRSTVCISVQGRIAPGYSSTIPVPAGAFGVVRRPAARAIGFDAGVPTGGRTHDDL